jgi:hypothetical protein
MIRSAIMEKNLSAIDKVYSRLSKYASKEEKIKYCKSVLQRTKVYIEKNKDALTEHIVNNSAEMIEAASTEIDKLSSEKKSI